MSLNDALILQKQIEQREPDLDALVSFLSYLRHEFKHQAVEPKSIEIYFTYLIKGSFHSTLKVSQYSFACLCHLVKRIYYQDQPKLRRYANDVVPVLIEKLAEPSKVHDIARKALTDYWRATSLDVERCIRKAGFLNEHDLVREQTLRFLCSLQATETKFVFRTLLFDIVSALRDSSERVQHACKECIIELHRSASPQALVDLQAELKSQDISVDIVKVVLRELGVKDTEIVDPVQAIITKQESIVQAASSPLAPAPTHQRRTPLAVLPVKHVDENRNALATTPLTMITMTTNIITAPTELSPSAGAFLKKLEGSLMEDMTAADVASSRDLELLMENMIPSFEGKETESNWAQRQDNIIKLRKLVRGNGPVEFSIVFITWLRNLNDGIGKAISSLRTTLSTHGCKLVLDLATVVKTGIDPFVDGFFQPLLKLSSSTKKIAGNNSNVAISVLLAHTSLQPRVVHHVAAACKDKNAQTRLFAAGWLQLVMIAHRSQRSVFEGLNCVEAFESSIKICLADANPKVRETIRLTFWDFHNLWPQRANLLMGKLDVMVKKQLDKANPRPDKTATGTSTGSIAIGNDKKKRAPPSRRMPLSTRS
ncbi:clasp N terminal-domain-containing protein [Lipomyces japonicus]|uniref:clasp N terminal-domain-containing protein n=1 Tax=Lipomyces japonicus TaxID=56871 RepID=UPI0034CF6B85